MPLTTEMTDPVRCTICHRTYDLAGIRSSAGLPVRKWTAPCCLTEVTHDQADYVRVRMN